jgi:hypothetical protein
MKCGVRSGELCGGGTRWLCARGTFVYLWDSREGAKEVFR